jgi:FG-GAP repeat
VAISRQRVGILARLPAGWIAPGDFSGDGKPDVLARKPDGTLWMYRGNGAGNWIDFAGGIQVGAGWNMFDAVVAVGR